MKLKNFVLSSLFLAIGFLLHQITPPFLFGMKPDFLLIMMFIAIFLVNDYKITLIVGIVSGILTAAATTFPGGQIPNLIDKIITCQMVYILFKTLKNKLNSNMNIIIVCIIGTFISGMIFLTSAFFIVGLPVSFGVLVLTVVLPATLINTVASFFLFKIVNTALRYSM
ncbi:ABC-type multidrug transport system fused ATPase/permease subunit [Clostridium tetanomorphum]|uniref:tryptophan transporter n=1 Tax=Clostridium tetanomorphum TaxID=1553 RepID=UPI000450B7D6|nr:tryptophan transporter [Clostridium tetanomorphum]KAJ51790.1 tryptophan transport protein [Clostridium tetanomorphum DSM 665]MBP1865025.1 ABC-type multidrug transport system fused ATPase/permease subunit [Clostridium tetanomorphum]NRS83377.1 ABC-type multidrug transport system fused ATPase/permease subunit [Clostridium tetanomorphum]SQC01438.1 tryptophan transport protein [Clostridium tetanomorphum]